MEHANLRPKEIRAHVIELAEAARPLARVSLQTVTVLVPLLHNPKMFGIRMPVWIGKTWQTISEIQVGFSGMSIYLGLGWFAEDKRWDPHLRIDFDSEITPHLEEHLGRWSQKLARRFRQKSIYMKISGPITWT